MIDFKQFQYQKLQSGETLCYRVFKNNNQQKIDNLQKQINSPTIILIHGNHTGQSSWNWLIQDLINKDPKFKKIISLDMRGFGRSSYNNKSINLEDQADDIIEFINIKKLENIVLVGWSTGGLVSMVISSKTSNLVRKIILVGSVSYDGFQFTKFDKILKKNVIRDPKELRIRLNQTIGPIFSDKSKESTEKLAGFVQSFMFSQEDGAKNPEGQYFQDLVQETQMQQNYIDANIALHTFDYFKRNPQKKICSSTLILHGKQDFIVPVEQAYQNAHFLHNQDFILLDNCGHSPIFTHTQECTKIFLNFIYNDQIPKL